MRSLLIAVGSALCLLLPGSATAQWSADSLQNLQVCDVTGEQVTPKIAATSDGGCFISWFDSRSGSYCLYLQRLDADGNKLFAADGLLISDKPQQSWLVDYDMAVDAGDNAIIVFSDTRNSPDELDVSAYRIGSDGSFLWGADGICLSNTSESSFEAAPKVAVTGAGNCVFAWGKSGTDYTIQLQKLSPDGDKLWGDYGITLDDPVRNLSLPIPVASGTDNAILLYESATGSYPYPTIWLYTGLLDASGNWGWGGAPILIYDSGHISAWSLPEIEPDGQDGAIYSWYDAPNLSNFNVWVQHMDASGGMLFPMNGAQASTNSNDRLHMNPSAVYYSAQNQTLVYWVEENVNQDSYGVYGQLLSPTGDRLWTDSGLELVPMGTSQISFVSAQADAGGVYVAYFLGSYGMSVKVLRTGYDGGTIWSPVTLSAASLGGKDDLVDCEGIGAGDICAWCDNRNDYGIYAQRINQNGSLGPAMGVGGEPASPAGAIFVSPNPSSGAMTVSFSSGSAGGTSLQVFDLSGRLVTTLFSGDVGPGGHSFVWNPGDGAAHGMYIVRLTTPAGASSQRAVLL